MKSILTHSHILFLYESWTQHFSAELLVAAVKLRTVMHVAHGLQRMSGALGVSCSVFEVRSWVGGFTLGLWSFPMHFRSKRQARNKEIT